jgi:hypothetical protein
MMRETVLCIHCGIEFEVEDVNESDFVCEECKKLGCWDESDPEDNITSMMPGGR